MKKAKYMLEPLEGKHFVLWCDEVLGEYVAGLDCIASRTTGIREWNRFMLNPRYDLQEAYEFVKAELEAETNRIELSAPWSEESQ